MVQWYCGQCGKVTPKSCPCLPLRASPNRLSFIWNNVFTVPMTIWGFVANTVAGSINPWLPKNRVLAQVKYLHLNLHLLWHRLLLHCKSSSLPFAAISSSYPSTTTSTSLFFAPPNPPPPLPPPRYPPSSSRSSDNNSIWVGWVGWSEVGRGGTRGTTIKKRRSH